ncbi:hypothetical protein Ahy_B01g053311 isoform A [Arachis hypogaea]|uniref:2Fe-2S ferredoxin-type domain-containing protein n=1 Tax=Arachis hypogaea TaxID=3818 RepID=A0A445ARM0_ARAHY|nr:hypothetical protein Ahy_B01g053311 isoform A [Arachis hypogaea]
MALRIPCNCCIPFSNHQSSASNAFYTAAFTNRRKSTSAARAELRTQVDVTPPTAYSSPSGEVPTHKVTVHDTQRGIVHEFVVPEDQYILHTAESQNITLPFACRHGCCTSCAGYALLCVGFPSTDVEVETQDEDEERDDYALELAMGDE